MSLAFFTARYRKQVRNYEFGVGKGSTLLSCIDALGEYCQDRRLDFYKHHIFLFDSFCGLPPKRSPRDNHPRCLTKIRRLLLMGGVDFSHNNVRFIPGFYKDVLALELACKCEDFLPTIVNIDMDYYSSTVTVLNWLRPLLQPYTIIYFDGVFAFGQDDRFGQLATIKEFNRLHANSLRRLRRVPRNLEGELYVYYDGQTYEEVEEFYGRRFANFYSVREYKLKT